MKNKGEFPCKKVHFNAWQSSPKGTWILTMCGKWRKSNELVFAVALYYM